MDQSAMQLGDAGPAAGATAGPLLPFCDSPALVSSDSGVFFPSASRKRPREDFSSSSSSSSSHVHRLLLDLDRLVVDHVARLRTELVGRLRRILAAAEEGASKRLRAKEEEVELARKVALALEERLKSLSIENQMWRELARSGEAAVCALRADLDRALAEAATADAESCCRGDSAAAVAARRACRCCGEMEPTVLLLPCRHLCACAVCGPAAAACPVCDSRKNGHVLVNMSD
ncbi:probable BOI-related E3 ubiquitin-protein ligase 3 [Zingiber officinale]|uniref:probable BOI-related E3 ubiquitin-protein ligase 3 n=1 Tax=Zingiber officinale TaxID=94328 RepID=UPI001C4C9A65|nr:probable BOI-related E3 ubiquitin-protein ligase 3 [Zingiber officinale]